MQKVNSFKFVKSSVRATRPGLDRGITQAAGCLNRLQMTSLLAQSATWLTFCCCCCCCFGSETRPVVNNWLRLFVMPTAAVAAAATATKATDPSASTIINKQRGHLKLDRQKRKINRSSNWDTGTINTVFTFLTLDLCVSRSHQSRPLSVDDVTHTHTQAEEGR